MCDVEMNVMYTDQFNCDIEQCAVTESTTESHSTMSTYPHKLFFKKWNVKEKQQF